jgi:hypothetical protein
MVLFSLYVVAMHVNAQEKSILKVQETSRGPFAEQKSMSCLTVYSDGRVIFFHRWNPGRLKTDPKTGKKSLLEQTLSIESHLNRAELLGVSDFLSSGILNAIGKSFVVPHVYFDYVEAATVSFTGQDAKEKRISIFDYGEASLEQKSRLPAALIVLMDKIAEIKKAATLNGKATKTPAECPEEMASTDQGRD